MKCRMLAAGMCLLAAGGCSLFGPSKPKLIKGLQKETSSHYVYVLPRHSKSTATQPRADGRQYYRDAYDAIGANQEQVRDEIVYDLMGIIDTNYRNYEMALRDDRNVKDLGSTLVAMGLTSAATVVGGEELKTILSAIATGVLAANASVDKQLFHEFATEAIINEMRARRDEVATTIISSLKTQDPASYPLEAGLRDIVNYYYTGTVTNALQSLVAQASTHSNTASNERKAVTEKPKKVWRRELGIP